MSAVRYFMRAYWSKHMYRRCALAEENRERERERETAEGGRANCQGKEGGWGAGEWSWRRKRYEGVLSQNPRTYRQVRNQVWILESWLWLDGLSLFDCIR